MKRIAIDFGSGVTKIYMVGSGVVLREATCIAVEKSEEGGRVVIPKAFGDKAKALSGRSAISTRIINPVVEGDIVQEGLATVLLKYFLRKIEITEKNAKWVEAIFILPCGCEVELKEKYKRMADECGIGSVYFTATPFAAVLGHNVPINESTPMFCVDIGYGITDIAAVSQDGIIKGVNLNLGGNNIDVHLIEHIAKTRDLIIGSLTAERLKNSVASLLPNDNKITLIEGRDVASGAPNSHSVSSTQICDIIKQYADKIAEYVSAVMSKFSAEVASSIMKGGVYLSGGLVKMDGFPEYFEKRLGIIVNLPEDPELAPVIGAGAILSDDAIFEKLATR